MNDFFDSDINKSNDKNEDAIFNNFNIVSLFGKQTLENIQEKVSKATGLAFVTVDYKGEPVTEMTSFTSFCQAVRKRKGAEHICKSSDAFGAIQAAVTQKTYLYFCPCGLLEVAIPIIVRGHYLGGFIGGQVRCQDAPAEICSLENLMQHIEDFKENEDMSKLYKNISLFEYKKFVYVADLISLIINQLGEKELSRIIQKDYLKKEMEILNEKRRRVELENSLKNSQLNALKSQMNPHFLLNSLNSISNLAVIENAPRTNEMSTMFAEFLRYNIVNTKNAIYISEEMANIERYLKIQKIRFGEQLKYSIDISENMQLQKIPCLIVMPFIENAVLHGIVLKCEGGFVSISVYYQQNDVVILVEDNGLGINDKKISEIFEPYKEGYEGDSIGIGISNTRKRLITAFGSDYDVVIQSVEGKGTKSIIKYPKDFDERVV